MVADPELKNTNNGTQVSNFRVAWSEKFKDRENKLFIECKAFGALAEFICKHFSRGNELVVEGKLNTEEWTGQDGQKRSKVVLMVTGVHFSGKKQDNAEPVQESGGFPEVEADRLPF
jgi:single-strand DNA-binding protein